MIELKYSLIFLICSLKWKLILFSYCSFSALILKKSSFLFSIFCFNSLTSFLNFILSVLKQIVLWSVWPTTQIEQGKIEWVLQKNLILLFGCLKQ